MAGKKAGKVNFSLSPSVKIKAVNIAQKKCNGKERKNRIKKFSPDVWRKYIRFSKHGREIPRVPAEIMISLELFFRKITSEKNLANSSRNPLTKNVYKKKPPMLVFISSKKGETIDSKNEHGKNKKIPKKEEIAI